MKRRMIITAVIDVHPRHSTGWVKDHLLDLVNEFAPVKHITVEHFQDKETK